MSAIRHSFPYHPGLGQRLCEQAGSASRPLWLRLGSAREELFCAYPVQTIQLGNQFVKEEKGDITLIACTDFKEFWQAANTLLQAMPTPAGLEDMPFRGGLAGFVGYDSTRPKNATRLPFPDACLGLYPRFIYINHAEKKAEQVVLPGYPGAHADWEALLAAVNSITDAANSRAGFSLVTNFQALTGAPQYQQHFHHIQRYLRNGDCYQVNYAQGFRARCQGSSASAMQTLLALSNPAYAAWLSLPEGDILSLSPELFLHVQAGRITTKPIKGTAPRGGNSAEDEAIGQALATSRKNRAENLMIVDLLRHDLGLHAETGSVKVTKLFDVERLPQVHHLVSTITANLKSESQAIDLIRDCFPGGSITGAPKKRAMEIIAELEPTPRSIYCGSIGFINADGDAQLNIAIRTLLRLGDDLYTWAGGGIVADSDGEAEYQECFDKMGALMRALEGMGKV